MLDAAPVPNAPPLTHADSLVALTKAAMETVDALLIDLLNNVTLTTHTARIQVLTASATGVSICLLRTSKRIAIAKKAAQLFELRGGAVLAAEFTAIASEALRIDPDCDIHVTALVDAAEKKVAEKSAAAAKKRSRAPSASRGKGAGGAGNRGDRGSSGGGGGGGVKRGAAAAAAKPS
ncbi:hypothetical protein M885DRAFT_544849 [Pelagophyceae sp. CCMP2097]|nr:hypothetical protein M885DRAFT_544849 [Pelagophyceae sp. CCMP2097]|mmetsp:Transcript_19075/g.65547  ORF Transcript_19075/g.65547 Transcript_19075/m.65547 type:complete len:178 (+) Transcript_19075:682-1215(+)